MGMGVTVSNPIGSMVGTLEIENSAVTNAKLAANAVTNVNVDAAAAIVESKIAFNTSTGHDHDGTDSKTISGAMTFIRSGRGTSSSATPVELDAGTLVGAGVAGTNDHYMVIVFAKKTGVAGASGQLIVRYNSNAANVDVTFDVGTTPADTGGFKCQFGHGATANDCTGFLQGNYNDLAVVADANTAIGANPLTGAHTISLRGRAGDAANTIAWAWTVWRVSGA